MVRLVDEALKGPLFDRPEGFASEDVTIADPAVGTGTFLLGVLRRIVQTVGDDLGPGGIPGALEKAAGRLIGFELQFGPFAVAQLRLLAEYAELMQDAGAAGDLPAPKLFITDTLGNPFVEEEYIPSIMQPVAQSRRDANNIKRNQEITVVIGNPPYKDKAKGMGGWIEEGSIGRPSAMDTWTPPREWGVGAHAKHLKNLYVFFWRWATWKVFGLGYPQTTGLECGDREGIICLITASGWLGGDGFQKFRSDLRENCDDIWVVDCSPEGHQPEVNTRIFEGVQQPICIVLAAKRSNKNKETLANVWYRRLNFGKREEKFAELSSLSLVDSGWLKANGERRAPFVPSAQGRWADFIPLSALFSFSSSGVLPGRTWVVAPDRQSLSKRWDRLVNENNAEAKESLFFPTLRDGMLADRHTNKIVNEHLTGHGHRNVVVAKDTGPVAKPIRFGFRSFDQQWIIPDNRLLLSSRPELWRAYSSQQTYLISLEKRAPSNGPAVTLSSLLPDMNFFKGSSGGRVFPIWQDLAGKSSNLRPAILRALSENLGYEVSGIEVFSYIVALLSHGRFTTEFATDLVEPSLRVPVTANADLFVQAVALGREVIWLHTYGERFDDSAAGRPKQPPRLEKALAPIIPIGGAIPGAPAPLPDEIDYDPAARRLRIGAGHIDNVMPEIWAYEVSGKQVVKQWFSYRRRDRSRPMIGDRRPPSPLDSIQPDHWLGEYTSDLMNLLHVLGRLVLLEPRQAELLEQILGQPLLTLADLGLTPDNGSESQENGGDGPA